MTPDELAHALAARRIASGWMARCPAHDDRNPSLAITERGGKLLLHCHAGCGQRDVIAALRDLGLWESSPTVQTQYTPKRTIVATYDYTDENGTLLYQVVRYAPKDFRQRRPDGGGWIWRKHTRQVLYRLPEVLEAPIVFLVEGEKDAEALRQHGFCATTAAGGANARWLPEYTEALRGREVIVWPDDDVPGWRRGVKIARALFGQAARVSLLKEMGAKDAAGWFAAGHRETELVAIVEEPGYAEKS
jgi:5S rRNA maturation endonuclease (ribonuclease M5)